MRAAVSAQAAKLDSYSGVEAPQAENESPSSIGAFCHDLFATPAGAPSVPRPRDPYRLVGRMPGICSANAFAASPPFALHCRAPPAHGGAARGRSQVAPLGDVSPGAPVGNGAGRLLGRRRSP